jgi:hypothetical protein
MQWFVLLCTLIVPFLVGVATTIAMATPPVHGFAIVIGVALLWLVVAHKVRTVLREHKPKTWIRWWVITTAILPLAGLFAKSVANDPAVVAIFERRADANRKLDPNAVAPAAPARHLLTWRETLELLDSLQQPAGRFFWPLLTSLPPTWWAIAFGIALWKGTK